MPEKTRTAPSPTRSSAHRLLAVLSALAALLVGVPAAASTADAPVVAAPQIVPFDAWAPAECPTVPSDQPTEPARLVVHHTHEPVAHTPDEVLPALAKICSTHVERGFATIGYHYVVDPWGTVYQARGGLPGEGGRAPTIQPEGAHVAGSNPGAVGVVFLGDHENEPPSDAALTAATELLAWLLQDLDVDPADTVPSVSTGAGTARFEGTFHPQSVAGHTDSNATACPGIHLRERLPGIRSRVRQLLDGVPMTPWGTPAETATSRPKAKRTATPGAGPRATPTTVLARALRHVGLASLADRLAAVDARD